MRKFYLPAIKVSIFTNLLKNSLKTLIFCIVLINFGYVKSESIGYIQKQHYISTGSEENGVFSYTFSGDRTSFSVSDYCKVTGIRTETNESDTIFGQGSRGGGAYRSQVTIRYGENPDDIVPIICFYSSMYGYNAIYRSQDIHSLENGALQRNLTPRNEIAFDRSDNTILTGNCNWGGGNRFYHIPNGTDPSVGNLYSRGDLSLSCNLIFKESGKHTITIEDPLYKKSSPNSGQITQIKVGLSGTYYTPIKNSYGTTIQNYPDAPTLYDNDKNAEAITIDGLPQLKILDLSNNKITSTSFLKNTQHNDSLEYINLTNNPITSTSEQFFVKIQENTLQDTDIYFKRFGYSYKETSPKYKRELKNNQNETIRSGIMTGTNGRNEIKNINIGNNFQGKFRISILNSNNEVAYDEVSLNIGNNEDSPSQDVLGPYEDFYLKEANINVRGLSGSIPLEAAHPGNTQSSHPSLDGILETTDIQNFTQNWYDLDLFLVDGEGNVGHHTIMDRNMGASEVYNKKFGLGNINTGSFGYRYQWGNNYGFTPCYTNGCSDFSENSDGVVVPYYLREDWRDPLPYFAHNVWDDGYAIVDSVDDYDVGTPPLSIRLQQLENLRGGIGDTYDGEGNYDEGDGTIVYNNTTQTRSRKGPCPNGYHVPSMNEWDKILVGWGYAKNKEVNAGDYYGTVIWGDNEGKNFASDLLLPPTGYRRAQGYVGGQQGDIGEYRSSSPEEGGIAMSVPIGWPVITARGLEFDSTSIYEYSREVSHSSDEGKSVRCIKDSPDSELNVYPNGGTNAFISIYKGEIIALGSPKRAGYTFEGWYRNENFTGEKVKVGDNVDNRWERVGIGERSIPHLDLYAKRKANPKCTDLPSNATANNFNTPTSDTKYYYSTNKSLTCTFQCNPNYTWNSTTSKCVPNECQGTLPANATLWNPNIIPSNNTTSYSYSATSTTEACTFKCNTNYTWNSSTSSCVNNTPTTYQCIGTLPANSTRNNNITPDKNTNYYYSTDISLACTFHCNTNYTWNSSTSSCQITPQTYTLTINYKYSDGSTASATVTKTLTGGASYSVSSPIISNYTASTSVVKGTMPNSDKTIDVVYTKIQTTGGGGGGSSSSSSSNSTLEISVSPSSPDTYEGIKVTIETDDDYTDKVYFSKLQYRSSSSSSWSNISRTSSTYVSDYSSAWSNGYYKMTSSDDGEVTLRNLVEFKKSGYYRIYIEDTDGNEDYVQINVYGSDGTSNSTLEISVSPSSPDTYERIKVTIETDDDYTDKINFSKFQYKFSSSSSWSNISRTSSTYVSDYSSDWSNGYYKMTSSDDGEAVLKNLVKFKKSGYYRIYIEDIDGNEDYVQINVNEDSENNSNENSNDSNLSLSVNNRYPISYEPISLTINTDNYVGKIKLYAKYKDSSSNRTKITNTSSTYFENYSNIWENGYYKMTSSDKGKKILNNLIEIKKAGSYRIYAEDEQGYLNYVTVEVDSMIGTIYNDPPTNNTSQTSTGDDIDRLINQLLGSDISSNNTNSNTQNDDGIERNKNNLKNISDEIYKSRSCKEYRIQYDSTLGAFTSPDLQKTEYFINKEYFKRYIDSKNPQKEGCPTNAGWISTSYKDSSTSSTHVITPNGKVYFISAGNGSYYSNNLTTNKSFASLIEIKNFIKNRNPLINMAKTK